MSKQQTHTPTPWVRNTQLNQIKGPDPKLPAIAAAVYGERDARLITASTAAFDSAAARLGLNAVELAEQMQDGGVAELVEALKRGSSKSWVANAGITSDIEALRAICLEHADWWNTIVCPLLVKLGVEP